MENIYVVYEYVGKSRKLYSVGTYNNLRDAVDRAGRFRYTKILKNGKKLPEAELNIINNKIDF
jgi:hypothetical protein